MNFQTTFSYQYKDHLGNNRLSYADSNGNGKIDTPASTGVTVWEDGFEDKSTANGDWDGSGNSWGWAINGIGNTKTKSGTKAGYISLDGLTDGWQNRACHSNEWIAINNSEPTPYRFSGWIHADTNLHRTRMYLFMKTAQETAYYTQFADIFESQKGKWVYVQRVVMVPPEIKKLNVRIDADGYGQRGGTAWFDDLKIEKLDMSQNEIVSETNYYPFGLAHKGYNEQTTSNNLGENYKFNGKELNDEFGLNFTDFGWRNYMSDIGRWMNVDPMADKLVSFTPYNYALGNPIVFIDPDGMFPYTFHVRSFHPNVTFAGGFMGDNRGFSNNRSASSRIHQSFTFDTDKGKVTSSGFANNFSMHSAGLFASRGAWGIGTETPSTGEFGVINNGNSFSISNKFSGSNPLTPGAPAIDISYSFGIIEDKENGLLSLTANIKGDGYPNAEAFIEDASGNSVFIGGFTKEGSPYTSLWGKGNKNMIQSAFQIQIDGDGNFTGVKHGDNTYTLDEWNGSTSGKMSLDEFKEKYTALYNTLFKNQ